MATDNFDKVGYDGGGDTDDATCSGDNRTALRSEQPRPRRPAGQTLEEKAPQIARLGARTMFIFVRRTTTLTFKNHFPVDFH